MSSRKRNKKLHRREIRGQREKVKDQNRKRKVDEEIRQYAGMK